LEREAIDRLRRTASQQEFQVLVAESWQKFLEVADAVRWWLQWP